MPRLLLLAALLWLSPSLLASQSTPLVVSTEWLASKLGDPSVVVLAVGARGASGGDGHIPGARFVPYRALVRDVAGVAHELPTPDSLRALLEGLGVSDDTHVVLTGRPLAVTRAFYTLDYLGHRRVSALDGGVTKWKREGRPIDATPATPPVRGRLTPRAPRSEVVASTDWVLERVGKPGVALFDTRTEHEYLGTEHTDGHIEGAYRIDWHDFLVDTAEFALADRSTLERLWRERLRASTDTVVAYCAVGYRASGTYFVSRLLGIPVKLYDGSYDAWSRRGLRLVKTPTVLRAIPAGTSTGGPPARSRH
jgi:thiosulfate/3-mercaptopyruvate sulfurtransferase